ncbi:MAG: hypothetical protein BGO67_03860 [Alphaproteobacteria bacterium 41-28]|nr:MAG: hypothetical protein BGO67_03860 [Alphaproteobacteria bacterium 41-28]
MHSLVQVEKHLRPGAVYRRSDLTKWSKAVDRHLQQLQKKGTLVKLSGGLYYYPKMTAFGEVPADGHALVASFLKDNRFLMTTPNAYNALGVGTTQLYNETVVYNHKRHGHFQLGGRAFDFRMKPHFPRKLSPEFLLVDLVNNIEKLAEDKNKVLNNVKKKALSMNPKTLSQAVFHYGGAHARKFFSEILSKERLKHGA